MNLSKNTIIVAFCAVSAMSVPTTPTRAAVTLGFSFGEDEVGRAVTPGFSFGEDEVDSVIGNPVMRNPPATTSCFTNPSTLKALGTVARCIIAGITAFAFSGIMVRGEVTNGLARAPRALNGAIGASTANGAMAGTVIANGMSAWSKSGWSAKVHAIEKSGLNLNAGMTATGGIGIDMAATDCAFSGRLLLWCRNRRRQKR